MKALPLDFCNIKKHQVRLKNYRRDWILNLEMSRKRNPVDLVYVTFKVHLSCVKRIANSYWSCFSVSSFFPLSRDSKIVWLFQGYQKHDFWNERYLKFVKSPVQEGEPDLWLTGAIGEHLKWQKLWWFAEYQTRWVLPRSLFRVLSASAGGWKQRL